MMRLETLDEDSWEAAWRAVPADRREVYYTPGYHAACARWERAAARCVRVANEAGWMLYPFLEHAIDAAACDIQSAYGYGGPLFVGELGPEERVTALAEVGTYLRSIGAVAEFVRCHTEWIPAELTTADYRAFQVRTNVECDLTVDDFEVAWAPGARRNLRKARSARLAAHDGAGSADWTAFARLYAQTAERLEMSEEYRFDAQYFEDLSRLPSARLILIDAPEIANPVAGAVVFLGGRLAHYHLGASDFAHQEKRPNDFLYHAMAVAARAAECQRIVWGGGMSNDPDDSLFRFKTHFGGVRRPVFCAGRVIDAAKYGALNAAWQARNPERESKLFLKYRAPSHG